MFFCVGESMAIACLGRLVTILVSLIQRKTLSIIPKLTFTCSAEFFTLSLFYLMCVLVCTVLHNSLAFFRPLVELACPWALPMAACGGILPKGTVFGVAPSRDALLQCARLVNKPKVSSRNESKFEHQCRKSNLGPLCLSIPSQMIALPTIYVKQPFT